MREIKFKIWDKTRNKWLFSNCGKFLLTQEGKAMFHMDGDNPLEPIIDQIEYEVLMYTGLKDKNGKEIYEGDILTRDGYWSIRIDYENGCCVARDLDKVRYNNKILDIPLCEYKSINKWKVIGNIYENPELLEDVDND